MAGWAQCAGTDSASSFECAEKEREREKARLFIISGIACIEEVRGREGWMDCHRPNRPRVQGKRGREGTLQREKEEEKNRETEESSKEPRRERERRRRNETRGHGEARTIGRTDQPWASGSL